MITSDEFGEQCRQIIEADDFIEIPAKELEPWGRDIVRGFIERAGLKWWASRETVGQPGCNARVIKIEDRYLKYLLTMPYKSYDEQKCDQFYWMIGTDPNNDDHAISPDAASAYLIAKEFPGATVRDIRKDDGSSVTQIKLPGKGEFTIALPPGFLSDDTYAKEE